MSSEYNGNHRVFLGVYKICWPLLQPTFKHKHISVNCRGPFMTTNRLTCKSASLSEWVDDVPPVLTALTGLALLRRLSPNRLAVLLENGSSFSDSRLLRLILEHQLLQTHLFIYCLRFKDRKTVTDLHSKLFAIHQIITTVVRPPD